MSIAYRSYLFFRNQTAFKYSFLTIEVSVVVGDEFTAEIAHRSLARAPHKVAALGFKEPTHKIGYTQGVKGKRIIKEFSLQT